MRILLINKDGYYKEIQWTGKLTHYINIPMLKWMNGCVGEGEIADHSTVEEHQYRYLAKTQNLYIFEEII